MTDHPKRHVEILYTWSQAIRELPHRNAGNEISFDIEDELVHLRKARPVDLAFTQSLEDRLHEWASEADEAFHADFRSWMLAHTQKNELSLPISVRLA